MRISRRKFITNTSLTVAGVALFPKNFFTGTKGTFITGLQLYSVRDDMKKDPLGTLKQLANMGYKHVEHANYIDRKFYGYSAKDFRKILDDLGLKMPSGHTVMNAKAWDKEKKEFTDAWKYTVEDAAVLGQQYVISPSLDQSYRKDINELKGFMEVFNKSGELCKKSGMKFGYHNHDFEFSEKLNGERLYDIMLKETDPSLVMQQLDIGNMYNGGGNPLEVLKKYPGRFSSLHVKDEVKAEAGGNEKYESAVLGTGIVPVKEVVDLATRSGDTHLIVEQESYQGKTPLECMALNLAVMKKWGY